MAEITTPTPATAWAAGELYRLPSGKVARLRQPGLSAMVARGALPNPVLTDVLRVTLDRTPDAATEEQRHTTYLRNVRVLTEIAALALQEPRLILDRAPDYAAGEIGPGDLAEADLMWLYYSFTLGGAAELAPFRVDRDAALG